MQTIIGNEFAKEVIPLIKQATNNINIVVYAWVWYPNDLGYNIQKFNNAIIDAAKRGVDVKVLTNDLPTIAILILNKIRAKKLDTKRVLHTKLMIIDNKTVILGSHNYTMSAFDMNFEVSVIDQNKEIVTRLDDYFENLWLS